jgi:hypothetical protein
MTKLLTFIDRLNDKNIFDSELMKVILGTQDYTSQMLKLFLPWLVMFATNQTYWTYHFDHSNQQTIFSHKFSHYIAAFLGLGLQCFFFIVEFIQMKNMKWDYWLDGWNLAAILSYTLSIYLWLEYFLTISVLITGEKIDDKNLEQITAVMLFISWFGLFYWMRLYEQVGFYITMILETINDILGFSLLFLMLIFAFSTSIMVLNEYDRDKDLDGTLVAIDT